jgi:hypothetical protein
METSVRKAMTVLLLISSLSTPTTSHAFSFFTSFGGSFSSNDKQIVDELEQRQDWNGMRELAGKRLRANDKDPAWLYIDGYALKQLDRCGEAIPQFRLALMLNTHYKEAQNELGCCLLATSQLDAAVSTLTGLIGKYPDFWQAYYNLGLVYVRKQNPANARIYLEQLRTRNMVMAGELEASQIKPLESRLEQERIAAANRGKAEEQERIEKKRLAKEEADAKAKAEAEAAASAEQFRLAKIQVAQASHNSLEQKLTELKRLYVNKLITKGIYNARRKELLMQR